MKRWLIGFLTLVLCTGCRAVPAPVQTVPTTASPAATVETTVCTKPILPEPAPDALVRVADYIPTLYVELRYAGESNFTGQQIYDFTDAYLRYGTVEKLQAAAAELESQGLYLKIWDAFRPVSAQFRLWEICPDPTYVANPETGFSSHSRGNTVDLTLVDSQGQELEMPTGFDDFSVLANRDYSDCPPNAAANALALEAVMERSGFTGYFGEWWHFSDTQRYPVARDFTPPAGEN